jgi:SAM-dependent methyltransferase
MSLSPEMQASYAGRSGTASVLGAPLLLDIGVGAHPVSGAIGVDVRAVPGAAVVADAVVGLPFRTSAIDGIRASHVVEHVADPLAFFREAWRVLRPAGTLLVVTPHFSSAVSVWGDPTHRRPFSATSFDYLDSRSLGSYADGFDYRVVSRYLRRRSDDNGLLTKAAERLANRSPAAIAHAEVHWAMAIGGFVEMHVVLTAVK